MTDQPFSETCQVFTMVMDRGQIVERCTHDELITMGGLYSQLYETQFRGERV
jgi:ABC-type multidrug transport system fused ATPase/permease subunit